MTHPAGSLPNKTRRQAARALPARRLFGFIDPGRGEGLLITIVILVGITIAAIGFFSTRYHYQALAGRDFARPAEHYAAVIGQAIDRYIEVINPIGAYFSASKEVERWEFLAFAEDALPRYPGLQAVQWVPRVTAKDRAEYEKNATSDGLYGFRIKEWDAFGNQVVAGKRDEYFPVYFVEPFNGNQRQMGLDLAANPDYREALDRARDTGAITVTGRVVVLDDTGPGNGVLTILPIYQAGKVPATVEGRRRGLIGFAIGAIRIDRMIASTLQELTTPINLDVYLYDESAPDGGRLLHFDPSSAAGGHRLPLPEAAARDGLYSEGRQDVADRRWSVIVRPSPGSFQSEGFLTPWGIAIMLLLLTALLVQYFVSSLNRTRMIEKSVTERTAELSATNTALELEVAERKRAEKESRAAKDQAEIANRAKSQFLAMVSHELRTPLNAIIGFSEFLATETFGPLGSEKYLEYAHDISDSGTHLLSLINDILDLSKIEANESTLSEESISLSETVRATVRLVSDKAEAAGLEIRLDVAKRLPRLWADERAIRQILINLLSNAVKFTTEGGKITIGAKVAADGRFELWVADTGIGIAEQDLAMVLLPFSQVDSSLARRFEGTGLGLPLSKKFAELHGGDLAIESELGRGTTVRVWFPAERVRQASGDKSKAGSKAARKHAAG